MIESLLEHQPSQMFCNERCLMFQLSNISCLKPRVWAWINSQRRCTSPLCLVLISTSTFPLPFLSHFPIILYLPPVCICLYLPREESGQKPSVSSGTAKGHTDLDGPLFHRNGTKGDGGFFIYHCLVTGLSKTSHHLNVREDAYLCVFSIIDVHLSTSLLVPVRLWLRQRAVSGWTQLLLRLLPLLRQRGRRCRCQAEVEQREAARSQHT